MKACEDVNGSPGDVSFASGPSNSSSSTSIALACCVLTPFGGGGKEAKSIDMVRSKTRFKLS